MFKKRKRVMNKRETEQEDWAGDEVNEEELASRPSKQIKKAGLAAAKQETQKVEQYRFESSQSAVPAGRDNQGALVDTAADRAEAKQQQKALKRAGPVFSATNVRISCRFDYQPDLCKDWKETGYCGYGESCKFLHDRGDYKSGWQIEKEWAEEQKKKQDRALYGKGSDDSSSASGDNEYFIGSDDEDIGGGLPFACLKCRGPFVSPVSTRCKHYFCEECAITHFKKDTRCFVCKEPTGGQFNIAYDLLKRLEKKAQEQKALQQDNDSDEGDGDGDGDGEGKGAGEGEGEGEKESSSSEKDDSAPSLFAQPPKPKGSWSEVK